MAIDKPRAQRIQAIGTDMLAMGHAPTIWQHANFAGLWFADSVRESTAPGQDARRREILFAVATVESFIFEWARNLVPLDSVESYFPAGDYNTSIKDRWKQVPKQLFKNGITKGVPALGQAWTEFLSLIDYRNGLLHARASRPQTGGMDAGSLPVPPLGALENMQPSWPTGVVVRLIVDLMGAAKTPIPNWLQAHLAAGGASRP